MSSVLITGCNGYLGVEMSMYFRMHDWTVYGIDMKPAPDCQRDVLKDFEEKKIQDMKAAPWLADAVVHLAGASRIVDDYPESHYRNHNVETTKRLRKLYPDTPLYFASTMAMYNEYKEIEHKHPYSSSKHEAEAYADVVFRMGSVSGTNREGVFYTVIDQMINTAVNKGEISVIEGKKMRGLAGITYICMMYYRQVTNGALAARAKRDGAKVVMHLYETCQSIENIAFSIVNCFDAMKDAKQASIECKYLGNGLDPKRAISCVPPDFHPNRIYGTRLFRLVMECFERYQYFVKNEGQ